MVLSARHRLIQFVGMDIHVRFDHLVNVKRFDSPMIAILMVSHTKSRVS